MGTTLTGTTPQDTYDSLIKVTDNGPISGTAKYLSDGLGNDSVLALSTSRVGIGTTSPDTALDVNGGSKFRGSISGFGGAEILLNAGNNSQVALSTNGTGTTEMYFDHRGTATGIWRFRDTGDTRMSLTSVGLGIGTSSPAFKLDVGGASPVVAINRASGNQPKLAFASSGSEYGSIIANASNGENRFSMGPSVGWGGYHTFYTNTAERLRIDASGNVGIGTSAPSTKLHVAGADAWMTLQRTSGTTNIIDFTDSAAARIGYIGAIASNISVLSTGSIIFAANSAEVGRFTPNGLTFNGDTAAANALDDYEEGTFTPTASSGITINTVVKATYTKIGNIVTFQVWLKVDITSANFIIAGLPVTISDRTACSVSNITSTQVIANQLVVSNTIYGYGATTGTNIDLFIGGNYRAA